jgi:hypothetical protein
MLTWGQTLSVKKVTIEKKDFPPLSPNGEYLLRYRIISEDKNRTSHWSPIYKLDATQFIQNVSGDLQISNDSLAISLVWGESQLKSGYDIFVSSGVYNEGISAVDWTNYAYHGSSLTQTYSFLRGTSVTDIRVKIQLSGIQKELNNALNICSLEASRR